MVTVLATVLDSTCSIIVDSAEQVRDGHRASGLLDLKTWPTWMRVIVRKECPHPGAQLRFTDSACLRLTAIGKNNMREYGQDIERRNRRRARCEIRIRTAKDTGLNKLPLHRSDQTRIWLAIVQLALDLLAWTELLAFTEQEVRRPETKSAYGHSRLRERDRT